MSALPSDRAQAALLRALTPLAGPFTLLAARTTAWHSATFEGARHRLAIRLDGDQAGPRAARLEATLPETELVVRGGFVADILVTARMEADGPVLGIEALTIDAGDVAPARISCGVRRAG